MSLFPFAAVVGLEEVKALLLMAAINPSIGPIAVVGPQGSGKSTAIRDLGELMPSEEFIFACPSNCSPSGGDLCDRCAKLAGKGPFKKVERTLPFVQFPLSSSAEDLTGFPRKFPPPEPDPWERFEPGLLARSNRGLLIVEKANLVQPDLLRILFDSLEAGKVTLGARGERFTYPFKTIPILEVDGPSMPDNLRRYCGLVANAGPLNSMEDRVLVLKRVQEFDLSPKGLTEEFAAETSALKDRISKARMALRGLRPDDSVLRAARKRAQGLGRPEGGPVLVELAKAAAALDEIEVSAELVEGLGVFMAPQSTGGR